MEVEGQQRGIAHGGNRLTGRIVHCGRSTGALYMEVGQQRGIVHGGRRSTERHCIWR